ncbi:MAG: T9SS type A sorting domain-containing protein [Fidelibacterota bacterium]|nr:MAG: T9SS type A sorting domain-containing protein [Candidatus Neomarinimicrobiota bacterium]
MLALNFFNQLPYITVFNDFIAKRYNKSTYTREFDIKMLQRSLWNLARVSFVCFLLVPRPSYGADSRAVNRYQTAAAARSVTQSSAAVEASFDVQSYRLDLAIPLVTNALTGTVTMKCRSLTANLDQIELDMDPTMTVSAVSHGAQAVIWSYSSSTYKLTIPLGQAVGLNDTFSITIDYVAADENNGFYSFEMSAYTDWAAGVFPCNDIPSDKATYDLHITVPTGAEVASIGLLEGRTVTGGGQWETFHWRTEYPVATYLVGIIISRFYARWSDWYVTPTGDSIEVAYYVFERDTTEAKLDFIHIVDAMDYYSTLFGPYPFEKYGMAEAEPMYYGGMEYQTMSMITSNWIRGDRRAENSMIHELVHQWWGNAVGFDDWPSLWLAEGFAEYTSAVYMGHQYGDDMFQALMAQKRERYLQQAAEKDYSIADPEFDMSIIGIIYKKGAWVLHMLRRVVGTENLWLILRNYYDTYKYSYATIADFRSAAEEVNGASLAWFFDEWLYDKGYPRIRATHQTNQMSSDQYECLITIHQDQDVPSQGPLFTMPLDLRLSGTSGTLDTTMWLSSASQTCTLLVSFEPQLLVLDPEGWLLMEVVSNSLAIDAAPPTVSRYQLECNYPNPFNAATTLRFHLPLDTDVVLTIYDLTGREVTRLVDGHLGAGLHQASWNALDAQGNQLPSGIYIARLHVPPQAGVTPEYAQSIKMLLLK